MKPILTLLFLLLMFQVSGDRCAAPNPRVIFHLKSWLYTYNTTATAKMRSEAIRRQRMILYSQPNRQIYEAYAIPGYDIVKRAQERQKKQMHVH